MKTLFPETEGSCWRQWVRILVKLLQNQSVWSSVYVPNNYVKTCGSLSLCSIKITAMGDFGLCKIKILQHSDSNETVSSNNFCTA